LSFFSVFRAIEQTGLSVWIRESDSVFAYWFILSFHAIGMGLLVGASVVIDLRILGVPPDLPLGPIKRLYRFIWVGFWIQVVSGVLLLIAYPTKSLTNPDFYLKLAMIAIALTLMQMLQKRVLSDGSLSETAMMAKGRTFAIWSLILWVGAVTAGRLLAYTYSTLTASLLEGVRHL
jgi:hypothetical protein